MTSPFRLGLSLLAAAPAGLAAQQLTVGSVTISPGHTGYGELRVPAGVDSGTTISVAVIAGARSGPTVALVAGLHGTEYTSEVALQRLISRLDPARLSGTVIVLPLVNVPSFLQMTPHLNPVDRKGMNGSYPGDANGTQTQRVAAVITDQVVRRADVVVDLHGGDLDEDLIPYSYWFRTGNPAQDSTGRVLALAFGLGHIIVNDLDLTNPAARGTLLGYAFSQGKQSVVAEAGRVGTVTPGDLAALEDGVLNVLGTLKMIERTVTPVEHPVWLDAGARLRADQAGVFFPSAPRGSYVTEGMKLGTLTDYLGREIATIRAPISGVITFIRGVPSVWRGATLVNVARVLETVPPWRKPTP